MQMSVPSDPPAGGTPFMARFLPLALALTALGAESGRVHADPPPSFRRHVEAVFSKLGCNGGTCHGSVKGQNGFRLSLFGADPTGDHERLLREFGGRRINLTDASASLLLRKPTGQAEHGGGTTTTCVHIRAWHVGVK